jgi:release factor glutamine methyltransferase
MKLKDLSSLFTTGLEALYHANEAHAMFLMVIDHQLGLNKSDYLLKKDTVVNAIDAEQMKYLLQQLQKGIPIQYVIGETYFFGLQFKVNSSVLIPRPETEELVEWVLEKAERLPQSSGYAERQTPNAKRLSILDIGTGSGCIAISLKKNLPEADVFGLDISAESIITAKENAVLNKVDVKFIEQDILNIPISNLTSQISNLKSPISIRNTQYAILISNPPYITHDEKSDMHTNVLSNEPHHALFVSNEQPLIFYEAIADFASTNLQNNGLLFFEINEFLGKETVDLLYDKGFKNIALRKDMQGKDRMICCEKVVAR